MSTFPVSTNYSSSTPSALTFAVDHEENSSKQIIRNTVTFEPSIWGDQFLTYHEKDDLVVEKQVVEELIEEVRKELLIKGSSSSDHDELLGMEHIVQLIDAVQRLGVAYHFEKEIEEALQHIYVTYGQQINNHINNLQTVSLWFRILRQQGFNVSSEIFNKYMDDKGNYLLSDDDVESMLALYEASYMRVEGEKVLDEALEFTKTRLAIMAQDPCCDPSLRSQIEEALRQPLRKRLPRLEAVRYMPIYQQQSSHNQLLLKLAKLDFNILQSMHKKELSQICKWWKDLEMEKKLPFVRDRLIEGYFWILGIYFEPHHARSRMFLTKSCMWLIVIDDTFDNYATYEELQVFTEAVERWSISCLDMLPEYMKLIYQELVNGHQEMEETLEKEGKAYHIQHEKELVKEYIGSLLVEAKWLKEGYMPTLDEYMSNSLITCAYPVMIARCYVGRDLVVTQDTFKWVATHPPLVKASSLILRLMDDIATHKKEQERGHVASSIECYRKENSSASEEEACEYFSKQVEDAWKVINRESLRPTDVVPFPLVMPPINLARICDVLYKGNNDGYGHAGKQVIQYINSLLVHPAPL